VGNPILVVNDDYTVYHQGREFALGSPPKLVWREPWHSLRPLLNISFDCVELPTPPPPKPKRTWVSAMGLKKPGGAR
jgi:hypothetical protein